MKTTTLFVANLAALVLTHPTIAAEQPASVAKPPASLKYLWAKAYYIPPETTTE